MFRRFLKLLLTLLLLVLIAAVGLVVMVATVEDPLSFTIRSEQLQPHAAAGGSSTGTSTATTLDCEVKNTSVFPMEILPATFTLLPAEDARAAFLPSSDAASDAVRLGPGETWQGKLHGPQPLNPKDIHTFSYDWNVRGQNELRGMLRWLDQNAGFLPDSWLAGLFWRTEPRKGRVKHVAMPASPVTENKAPPSPAPTNDGKAIP